MTIQGKRETMDWPGTLLAGVAATIVVTLTMLATGTNILEALGGMLAGPDAGVGQIYLMGGLMHLAVGLAYAVLFTLVFVRVRDWSAGTKGLVFGFVITVFALVFMPLMAGVVTGHGGAGANPCSPAAMSNPCHGSNPCAMKNPCHGSNPCAMKNPCSGGNPCNPSDGGNVYGGLISLLNHIVFGLTLSLAMAFRSKPQA